MSWNIVIGLEVHAQLATPHKIFSTSPTAFGAAPNAQANAVDMALPGVLPVLNREVVDMAVRFGLAVNAKINQHSVFARKNYFYPDLPKGYQISQFDAPIVGKGSVEITFEDGQNGNNPTRKTVGITRAHLEEDAGKSVHDIFTDYTAIDLNRAGTPLLEIVSEPELFSIPEAIAYAKTLHTLVQYLGICDGNMQEGSFRVDANISLNKPGAPLGTRAEIKNINSFRFLEKALHFEVARQQSLLDAGKTVVQETRLYDPDTDRTRSMRSKEEANDYRYFPDPDLPPLRLTDADITRIKTTLPELPDAKRARFIETLGLPAYDAEVLVASRALADYFEATLAALNKELNKELNNRDDASNAAHAKLSANWVMGEVSGYLNKHHITINDAPVSAAMLAELLACIVDDTISGKIAKDVLAWLWQANDVATDAADTRDAPANPKSARAWVAHKGLQQVSDTSALDGWIGDVMAANPAQVAEYRAGKEKLLGFFVGQVMKASRGQANPEIVNQRLREKLA